MYYGKSCASDINSGVYPSLTKKLGVLWETSKNTFAIRLKAVARTPSSKRASQNRGQNTGMTTFFSTI